MPGPVERWLETFMCKQYADTFEAYGFKTLQSVCQLQLQQLQAMGVAQEHCEKILENVHVLRQTLYGQINHYHDEMYPPVGGRMAGTGAAPSGYQGQNSQTVPGMASQSIANFQTQGGGSYGNRVQGTSGMQGQYAVYRGHNQSSQHYMAESYGSIQGSGPVGQGPYGPNQYNQMSSGYGPIGRSYSSGVMQQSGRQQQQQQQQKQQSGHHPTHMMHGGPGQSPQDVANSILQMTAAYQPNQTVQVPLSKNRHAPYHVPNSPHYVMPSQGNSPTHQQQHSQQQQQQAQGAPGGHQFVYPSSSPHHSHTSRTSPISPGSGYIHSPASHHSSQSLPNSSPRSIQSPTQHTGSVGGNVKSPVPPHSPVGSLKSPCAMQSPMNSGQSICSPTPVNQQLHVSVSSQNLLPFTGQSPTQQKNLSCYSPKTNPISPPASHISSPFTPLSKSSIHSPNQQDQYTSPRSTQEYISDNSQDPGVLGSTTGSNNPLMSLQKLCMLPEKQVVDPKSVVNDACLPSPQSRDNSKNFDTNADSQGSGGQGSTQGDSSCGSALGSNNSSSSQCTDGKHCNETSDSDVAKKPPHCDKVGHCQGDVPATTEKNIDISSGDQPESPPPLVGTADMVGKQECYKDNVDSHLKNTTCQTVINGDIQRDANLSFSSGKNALTDKALEEVSLNKTQDISDHLLKHRLSPSSALNKARTQNCDVKLIYSDDYVLNGETTVEEKIVDKFKMANHTKNKINNNKQEINEELEIYSSPAEVTLKEMKTDQSNNVSKSVDSTEQVNSKCEPGSPVGNGIMNKDRCENVSRNKLNSRRVQPERTMSLREVPARLANNAAYYNTYSDSDSNDDGILLVRKDTKRTYSQKSRRNYLNGVHSSDSSVYECSEEEDEEVVDLQKHSTKIEPDHCPNTEARTENPHGSQSKAVVSKDVKGSVGNSVGYSTNDQISSGQVLSKPKQPRKEKARKLMEDYVDMVSDDDSIKNNQPMKGGQLRTSKRKRRRRMSPLKYAGDMYYGGDYILDSEEELEVEIKSKKTRKPSGNPEKNKSFKELMILDSDGDVKESTDKVIKVHGGNPGKEITEKLPELSGGGSDCKPVENRVEKCDITNCEENLSLNSKKENPETNCTVAKDNRVDPDVKSNIFPSKSSSNKKRLGRPPGSKSSKGKLKKLEKSKSKGGYLSGDNIDDANLKRTLALMKKKHKKKTVFREKSVGPFIRLNGPLDSPKSCTVVNQLESDRQVDLSKHKKRSAAVAVSTVHLSRLPSEKSVLVPGSSVIDESSWVCALCKKHSSYKFLGDLFGPYYTDGNLPVPKVQEGALPDTAGSKRKKRKSDESSNCDGADKSKKSKSKGPGKSCSVSKVPQEVWVHEDCLAWADGVLLIGPKVYGLEEATRIALSMVCSVCKEAGAMVGCLHKGCSQQYHFYCAVETGCNLDEENFSLLCPKHKDKKKHKAADPSISKT